MEPFVVGEGLGYAVVAGVLAIVAWFGVGIAGLVLTARQPHAKD